MARALDLLGERWTLLIVRELLCGSRRFGEIQRGIPRISRTMLSARVRELADAGVIERHDGDAGPEYRLTPAGLELAAVVRELGTWGQRWLPRELHPNELDARALVWDIHRRVRRDALPEKPLVVRIELTDMRGAAARHYLLLRRTRGVALHGQPRLPGRAVSPRQPPNPDRVVARGPDLPAGARRGPGPRGTARVGPRVSGLVRALPVRRGHPCLPGTAARPPSPSEGGGVGPILRLNRLARCFITA